MKQMTEDTMSVEIWDGSKSWLVFHKRTGPTEGIWQQYTITWDHATMKVYVDGQLGSSVNTSKPMKIFVESGPSAQLALGVSRKKTLVQTQPEIFLDDFQIWEKHMNDTEVTAIYKAG